MVIYSLRASLATGIVAATGVAASRDEVPPGARATALMAFLGLILLGVFLLVGVVVATRWIRRQVRDDDKRRGT